LLVGVLVLALLATQMGAAVAARVVFYLRRVLLLRLVRLSQLR